MSYHSNTSSDVEPMPFKKIIQVFYTALRDNFCFNDVKPYVQDLFTKYEIESILNERGTAAKTVRLLWILNEKPDGLVERFVLALQRDYKFIKEPIMQEWGTPSLNTEKYVTLVHKLQSSDHKFMEYNVHRMEPYLQLHKALKQLKPFHNVMLSGDLGAGKKWLALDVLSEYSVQKSMDFNIFWLNMKNAHTPENDLDMLQQLRLLVEPHRYSNDSWSGAPDIENRKLYHQTKLSCLFSTDKLRNALVVLADVQNIKTLKAFNLGCKILALTRFKSVSEYLSAKTTEHLTLADELKLDEAKILFEKYMRCERDKFPSNAFASILKRTQNPLKLSFIASNLRENKNDWNRWTDINFQKLTAIVECSLNVLGRQSLYFFATLSIFPVGVDIPIELLAALWRKSNADTDDIIKEFQKYSFVKRNSENRSITLSNIYSAQLQESKLINDLIDSRDLHQQVVDSFNIYDAFDKRTDTELANMPNYFYGYIAHHLSQLQEHERSELFKKIFLDFGFLEQKIRIESCSILNTLIQLNFYKKQSYCDKRGLIQEICQFLPRVEEKLVHSKDTCLLQYALLENGLVYEEAYRQVQWYPQQVWFNEKGSFHQRRQILNLSNHSAQFARYLDQETCLVVLDNNHMLLVDISLECNNGTTELISDHSDIRQLEVFNEQRHLLTLDASGTIKLWALGEDARHINLVHRRSSKQKVHPLGQYNQFAKSKLHSLKPMWQMKELKRGPILAFNLDDTQPKQLHIAFENGDVCLYDWHGSQRFDRVRTFATETQQRQIRFLTKILHKYYLLITAAGVVSIWNINYTSKVYEMPLHTPAEMMSQPQTSSCHVVYMTTYADFGDDDKRYTVAIFVLRNKIMTMRFLHEAYTELEHKELQPELLYEHQGGAINCAKLSPDAQYLLLGTQQGLIVYDMRNRLPMLRSNVSEAIACLDIACMDMEDPRDPRYIILCGPKQRHWLHIHALRAGAQLSWMHNVECMANELLNAARLEPDVWLRGQKLYDVTYGHDASDAAAGDVQLVAVDSKNRIHQVCTNNNKNWSTIVPNESKYAITAVTTYEQQHTYVGYENGAIFNINKELYVTQDFIVDAIRYLQLLDADTLIASSWSTAKTLLLNLTTSETLELHESSRQAYKLYEQFLLLLGDNCLLCLNLLAPSDQQKIPFQSALAGFDFKASCLFLALHDSTILIYSFKFNNGKLEINVKTVANVAKEEVLLTDYNVPNPPSCLAANNDGNLIALGMKNGNIEVYKYNGDMKLNFIHRLSSHTREICDLKFSPNNDVLVSCAEQLCFWNVAHMINNPLIAYANSTKRRSSRFSSQRSFEDIAKDREKELSCGTEEVDAKPMSPYGRQLNVHNGNNNDNLRISVLRTRNSMEVPGDVFATAHEEATERPWQHRHGPASKPELYACIKFDGNQAVKFFANANFTQFNTIDDEGVYYHLQLLQPLKQQQQQQPEQQQVADIAADIAYEDYTAVHAATDDLMRLTVSAVSADDVAAAALDIADDGIDVAGNVYATTAVVGGGASIVPPDLTI